MDQATKVITDHFRPVGQRDALGVDGTRKLLGVAYDMLERDMADKPCAAGEVCTVGDVAGAPALFYANLVCPLAPAHRNLAAYLGRLMKRKSFARVVKEALRTWSGRGPLQPDRHGESAA